MFYRLIVGSQFRNALKALAFGSGFKAFKMFVFLQAHKIKNNSVNMCIIKPSTTWLNPFAEVLSFEVARP